MEKQAVIDIIKRRSPIATFSKQEVLTLIGLVDDTIEVKSNPRSTHQEIDKLINLIQSNYIYRKTMTKPDQEFVSLFDYLGHAAGSELGQAVYETAKRCKEKMQIRQVATKTYTGKIVMYRKAFLEEYFKSKRDQVSWTTTIVI